MPDILENLEILIVAAAEGRIDRNHFAVIDCVYLRGMSLRETARRLKCTHRTVQQRLRKVSTLSR